MAVAVADDCEPVFFRTLAADPPWQHQDQLGARGAKANYTTMSADEIAAITLPNLADDAYLFLWRLSSMVEEAYEVGRLWGFTPKSEIVWRKLTKGGRSWFGMGRYVRNAHEVAIVMARGKPARISKSIRSEFSAPVPTDRNGKYIHSAKPPEFYKLVEQLAPGPFCELFARENRVGWTALGGDLGHRL